MISRTFYDKEILKAFNTLEHYGLNAQEEMIDILCRINRTKKACANLADGVDVLYMTMNEVTQDMRPFYGNAELFFGLYERLHHLNEREYISCLNLSDEGRDPLIPSPLVEVFANHITDRVKTVLITECEKYGPALVDLIENHPWVSFTLTCRSIYRFELFKEIFSGRGNVKVVIADIYREGFTCAKYDLILAVPVFGSRLLIKEGDFISKETDLVALQNLLYHVNIDGELVIVLPAKITFAGGSTEVLRTYVEKNYKIKEVSALPSGLFYPYASVRSYLFVFSTGFTDDVVLKKYEVDKPTKKFSVCEKLNVINEQLVFSDEFEKLKGWNIDMAFCEEDDDIRSFSESNVKKVNLKEVGTVFRGKAVSVKSSKGNIGVVNISNISEFGIAYDGLDFIDEEERNIAKYALKNGDVLVTARGTTIKIAVFQEQDYICIPSANINVIRPKNILNGTYLKLFLESPVGMKLLKSLQRGETITNINFKDMYELEVPLLPMEEQEKIVKEYSEGFNFYRQTIAAAEEGWKGLLLNLQAKLY